MAAAAQPMMPPPPPPPTQTMGSPTVPEKRPTGITILAILNGLGGVLLLLGGFAMMAGGGTMATMMNADAGMFAALAGILGFVFLVLGALYLVAAWGLWTRKVWGWYVAMAGVVLGILNGLVSLPMGIVGLLIAGFIGWYLLTPGVQRWFGLNYNVPWNKQTPA